jgi:hypothetical protein
VSGESAAVCAARSENLVSKLRDPQFSRL